MAQLSDNARNQLLIQLNDLGVRAGAADRLETYRQKFGLSWDEIIVSDIPKRSVLLGMLGKLASDFSGERINAVTLINLFLTQHRLTWDTIIPRPTAVPPNAPPTVVPSARRRFHMNAWGWAAVVLVGWIILIVVIIPLSTPLPPPPVVAVVKKPVKPTVVPPPPLILNPSYGQRVPVAITLVVPCHDRSIPTGLRQEFCR